MLRALFLLSFTGGVLYAGLVATHSALTGDDASDEYSYIFSIRPPGSDAAAETLRSWGPSLQALRSRPNSEPSGQPWADRDNRPVSAALAVAAATSGQASAEEPIGWAKLALAARAHGEASVSSPITHFHRAGTELEIVGRDGAWLLLQDPATQERGWVFEKYVSLVDRPSATQVAAASPEPSTSAEAVAEEAAPKPKPAKIAAAKSKKAGRYAKPPARTPRIAVATLDPRQGRALRGERRGLGLFLFGPRMARLEAEGRLAR